MSVKAAKEFIERIKTDEEFAKKIEECRDREEKIMFARKKGFDFTVEELEEVSNNYNQK